MTTTPAIGGGSPRQAAVVGGWWWWLMAADDGGGQRLWRTAVGEVYFIVVYQFMGCGEKRQNADFHPHGNGKY
jgi:hypothetical protein